MTTTALTSLQLGISELLKYIKFVTNVNTVVARIGDFEFQSAEFDELKKLSNEFRRKKIFEYNSYIITLYGLFERFLENIVEEYLNLVCKNVNKYDEMHPVIVEKNQELSFDLIKNLSNPKYKQENLNKIVSNLHMGINNNIPCLNTLAFRHHAYNFRQSVVVDYFRNIGISNIENLLQSYSPLKEILDAKFGVTASLNSEVLFHPINELSQRRNEVAHGVENIELLDKSLIIEFLTFIEAYCITIFNILQDQFNRLKFDKSIREFNTVEVYNNNILCGSIENTCIKVGDILYAKRPKGNFPQYLQLKILEIQQNNTSVDSISTKEKLLVGLRLDHKIKKNFFIKYN